MANIIDQVNEKFPCTQCGLCCQNTHLSNQTQFLNRGDGVCFHYDEKRKTCMIYEDRPDICRIDKQYQAKYSDRFTWKEFINENLRICLHLQEVQQK